MKWNYRVIRYRAEGDYTECYAIHEVYYDEYGEPWNLTANAVCPVGETMEELREDLKHYMTALAYPILEMEDFEKGEM